MMLDTRQQRLLETLPVRSFATLMELYENNYILLRRLAPGLQSFSGSVVSQAPGAVDLHLRIVEQTPYTTVAALTHHFPLGSSDALEEPGLHVRVYHDAHAGEVLPESAVEQFNPWAGCAPPAKSLEWRWELNRFLNRWLRYCIAEGHEFPGYACGAFAAGDASSV